MSVSNAFMIDCMTGILLCAKTKLARVHLASYFADGTSRIGGKRLGKNHLLGYLHLLNLLLQLHLVVYLSRIEHP